jgi:hypothetical protein
MYTSSKRVDKGDIPDIGSILQGTGNANGEQNIKNVSSSNFSIIIINHIVTVAGSTYPH